MGMRPGKFHIETWYQHEAGTNASVSPPAGSLRCAVAIVGGGVSGLSLALGLVERGERDVVVLDAGPPGSGASGRNGGFVFAGYSLDNDALIRQRGRQTAQLLHGWTRAAVGLIRSRAQSMDCQVNDAGILLADWFGRRDRLLAWRDRMAKELDFHLEFVDRADMGGFVRSARYGDGVLEPGSFHFHPLRYCRGLAGRLAGAGVQVRAGSDVERIARQSGGWRLETAAGNVHADEVVLATGGYSTTLHPRIQRAVQPIATYVMVTEPLGERIRELLPTPVAVYDTRFAFDYYRPLPDTRLLWGGRISVRDRSPKKIRRLLRHDLKRVFPQLEAVRAEFTWSGWMSYARHQMPLLGRADDGVWYALAFGGHGLATTTLGGEVLAEALCGDTGRLEEFGYWPPVWAGGRAGRAWIQAIYAWKQLLDKVRDWRGRPKLAG